MDGHTPGPWLVKADGDLLCVTGRDSRYVVDRFIPGDRPYAERLANARLIAASPTMYDYMVKNAARGDGGAKTILDALGG